MEGGKDSTSIEEDQISLKWDQRRSNNKEQIVISLEM